MSKVNKNLQNLFLIFLMVGFLSAHETCILISCQFAKRFTQYKSVILRLHIAFINGDWKKKQSKNSQFFQYLKFPLRTQFLNLLQVVYWGSIFFFSKTKSRRSEQCRWRLFRIASSSVANLAKCLFYSFTNDPKRGKIIGIF